MDSELAISITSTLSASLILSLNPLVALISQIDINLVILPSQVVTYIIKKALIVTFNIEVNDIMI